MEAFSQSDLVRKAQRKESTGPIRTRRVLPGIKTLHLEPREEIAKTLANVLKSQKDIQEIRWVVGEYIEVTSSE